MIGWQTFVKRCRATNDFSRSELPPREWLHGKCVRAAQVLALAIAGKTVRGTYHGLVTDMAFLMATDPNGGHAHSWVEKDGTIYDPTWWEFTEAKLGIYQFPCSDKRYRKLST